MCCSKRNFIYLFCGLMLALNIQMLQAKLGNKIIFIPEDDLKKHGFDVPDGRFGYDCMAESDNLVIFWERSFGKEPAVNMDESKRFYPNVCNLPGKCRPRPPIVAHQTGTKPCPYRATNP